MTRADEAIRAGLYGEAATAALEALNLVERSSDEDGRRLRAINLLAVAKHLQGRFSEAEGLLQGAISAWRAQSDQRGRAALATGLYNLAQTQIELRQYDAAERSLAEVMAIRGDKELADLPDLEDVLSLFAFIYQAKGQAAEAEACANRAVSLARAHVGISPKQVAIVYNSQGRILLSNGRYDEAAISFKASLDWAVRAQGMDHPFTALAMFHLAEVYLEQSRTDLAEPLLTKGLRTVDGLFGPGSVASAEALENLGYLYTLDGKFALARQTLDRALAIEEAAFGESSPRLMRTLNRCASVCVFTNRNQEALNLLSRSLEIARGVPWLRGGFAMALRGRAFVEAKMGLIVEAEQDYKNAIATMEAVFGAEDSRLLPTLREYSSLLRKTHRPGLRDLNYRIKALQVVIRAASQRDSIGAGR
jgi:tetratricopeptide (TPR) repeat protein